LDIPKSSFTLPGDAPDNQVVRKEWWMKDKTRHVSGYGVKHVTHPKADTDNDSLFTVVGIGASAGGLEALEEFFINIPANSPHAFVVIQHLDPDHIGIMPELLQRVTTMKVHQATDGLKVLNNCVYIIPPNKSMSFLNGSLYLFEPVETRGLRLPIDFFLRSLANDRKDHCAAVVLSGMGSDGSIGVKAIKEHMGLVLVQDPESAKFSSMPQHAIESVTPDIVASPQVLAKELYKLIKSPSTYLTSRKSEVIEQSSYNKIIILIRHKTGQDFSLYKNNTLLRRIERRKGIHKIDAMSSYIRFLQRNPMEIEILFKEMLIGVTNFFRDREVWEMIKNNILPPLLMEHTDQSVFRVWIPACSTGEEAYSFAIIFREVLDTIKPKKNIELQLFATDLDIDAIDQARIGSFPLNIKTDVSQERLDRFFILKKDLYKINPVIRQNIVFAPQNVITDPPFTKLDFLLCRNLLIYLKSELQDVLIEKFSYSLKKDGILVLGNSESLGDRTSFTVINSKLKIFKRSESKTSPQFLSFTNATREKMKSEEVKPITAKPEQSFQVLADQLILQYYAPASVLVDDKGNILYISGKTGKYLEPAAGKANWNIFAMAKDEIRHGLPFAFREAVKSGESVVTSSTSISGKIGNQSIEIKVVCLKEPVALKGLFLVVFYETREVQQNIPKRAQHKRSKEGTFVYEVEQELLKAKDELNKTREEMQTSQEELKSTNEELQSTNEELQSTNEELTTSKEEMQSLNEELQTVNIELQSKVNSLIRTNDDMNNLLNSTQIATLFLDKDLNVRRYTNKVENLFKLRSSDIGRPFTDLVTTLNYSEIGSESRMVLKTLTAIEKSVSTHDNKWFSVRILPYRTVDDHIDGLVITFLDITISKRLELDLTQANEKLKQLNEE
jgi:two-component system CheB/CheR fusion protein